MADEISGTPIVGQEHREVLCSARTVGGPVRPCPSADPVQPIGERGVERGGGHHAHDPVDGRDVTPSLNLAGMYPQDVTGTQFVPGEIDFMSDGPTLDPHDELEVDPLWPSEFRLACTLPECLDRRDLERVDGAGKSPIPDLTDLGCLFSTNTRHSTTGTSAAAVPTLVDGLITTCSDTIPGHTVAVHVLEAMKMTGIRMTGTATAWTVRSTRCECDGGRIVRPAGAGGLRRFR